MVTKRQYTHQLIGPSYADFWPATSPAWFPLTTPPNPDRLTQLRQLTAGLYVVTEADAPLEVVSYPASGGEQSSPELLRPLGEPADAPVQVSSLVEFLRHHTDPAGVRDSPGLATR